MPARRLFHLSSPRTPAAKPRSPAQPFLPLISSPLKNVITKDPPVVPTIESDPSSPRDSGFIVDLGEVCLCDSRSVGMLIPEYSASGPAPSPTPAPEVFQRWVSHLNLVLGALFFMALMLICQCSSICRPDLPLPLPPACKPRRQSQRV